MFDKVTAFRNWLNFCLSLLFWQSPVRLSFGVLPHNEPSLSSVFKRVFIQCLTKGLLLIVDSYANTHHNFWSSSDINLRSYSLIRQYRSWITFFIGNRLTLMVSARKVVLDIIMLMRFAVPFVVWAMGLHALISLKPFSLFKGPYPYFLPSSPFPLLTHQVDD